MFYNGTYHKRLFAMMALPYRLIAKNRPFVEGGKGDGFASPSGNSFKACAEVGKALLVFLLLVVCSFSSMFLINLIAENIR